MTIDYAARIRHMPACTGADPYETTGARGDRMLRCRSCGRFAVLPASYITPEPKTPRPRPQDAPRTPEDAAPEPEPTPGRWRCAEHPDERRRR